MSNQKLLLKNVTIGESGRAHPCRRNKDHILPKGAKMLIVKEDRKNSHYCPECAAQLIKIARTTLSSLENELAI